MHFLQAWPSRLLPHVIAGVTFSVIAGLTFSIIAGVTFSIIAGVTRNLIDEMPEQIPGQARNDESPE